MIGDRIKRARAAAGLSQRDLADRVGVSAMAISKYERDEMTPGSEVLLAIAGALKVRTEYFFRPTRVTVEEVDYRKHASLPKKEQARIEALVGEQVERWVELDEILPGPWAAPFEVLGGLPERISKLGEVEAAAEQVRKEWELGLDPIPNLVDTLEVHGIKVFSIDYDAGKGFDGLAFRVADTPVLVCASDWPGDRQRFTLAHELGHLVLKGRLTDKLDEEKACHRFAGAFLVPRQKVIAALGQRRRWLEPKELQILKHEWGFSMNGWVHRAGELRILAPSNLREMWKLFSRKGWRKKEPGPAYPAERSDLFDQMVYRALGQDLIGESKAAELLQLTVSEFHRQRRMEATDGTDHR